MTSVCFLFWILMPAIGAQSANPLDIQWRKEASRDHSFNKDTLIESDVAVTPITSPDTPVMDIPMPVNVPEAVDVVVSTDTANVSPVNPFDLDRGRIQSLKDKTDGLPIVTIPKESDRVEKAVVEEPTEFSEEDTPEIAGNSFGEGIGIPNATNAIVSNLVLFLLFGLILLLLTWAVNIHHGFIRKVYRATLNENFSALLQREQKFASTQYLYYLVYVTFFINAGIFLYFVTRYTTLGLNFNSAPLMLFIGFTVVVYILRHLTLAVVGWTFPVTRELKHFSFNILLFNILLGLFLLPVNFFLAFGPTNMHSWLIGLGLVAIIITYVTRQFRGLVISSFPITSNMFHFFVYLCTIEILPVLVLFKFLHN